MGDGAGLGLVSPHCLLRRLTAHASIFIPKLLTLNFTPPVQDYAPSFFPVDPITYSTFLCTLHSTPNSRWPKLSLKVASPNPGFPEVKLTIMYLLEYIPLFIKLFTYKPGPWILLHFDLHTPPLLLLTDFTFLLPLCKLSLYRECIPSPFSYLIPITPQRSGQTLLPQEGLPWSSDLVRSPSYRLSATIYQYFLFAALSNSVIE